MSEIEDLNRELEDITKRLASAIASEMGVRVGSIIVVTRSVGYGNKARIQKSRYRVESIYYKGYGNPPIGLRARTIRKDGADGDRHEIWQDWMLEKPEESNA